MPFIGNQPTQGRFIELDSLSASATANYTLQLNSANYSPESVNNLLVSINGVIQGSSTRLLIMLGLQEASLVLMLCCKLKMLVPQRSLLGQQLYH